MTENTTLTRRRLLTFAAAAPAALLAARALEPRRAWAQATPAPAPTGPHTLPPLPYAYDALEPHIDTQTMQIHHGKHHQAYVNNLNTAVAKYADLQKHSAEDLIRNLGTVPEDVRTAIQNNAGGHVNHTMFWQIMKPQGGGQPNGPIADAIMKKFGSFDAFSKAFNDAGAARFGSGWTWLAQGKDGLVVLSTPNQDSPMMPAYGGMFPIMGNDVWEHAYYLKYQNRRADYLKAWWNVVNWDEINKRYTRAQTWIYK